MSTSTVDETRGPRVESTGYVGSEHVFDELL